MVMPALGLSRKIHLLKAFQTHQPARANSTQGSRALKTSNTTTTTRADTAVRFVSTFASSVM